MHLVIILLVIIILLLGGWWILAVGLGLLIALIGAVIGAVIWLFQHLWPFLLAAAGIFVALGLIGIVLEALGKGKPKPPADRPLPPFRRTRRKP